MHFRYVYVFFCFTFFIRLFSYIYIVGVAYFAVGCFSTVPGVNNNNILKPKNKIAENMYECKKWCLFSLSLSLLLTPSNFYFFLLPRCRSCSLWRQLHERKGTKKIKTNLHKIHCLNSLSMLIGIVPLLLLYLSLSLCFHQFCAFVFLNYTNVYHSVLYYWWLFLRWLSFCLYLVQVR